MLVRVAAGIICNAVGEVLIGQRPAHKHGGGYWEFPGGKLEPGEAPQAALVRELREELGIQVSRCEQLMQLAHEYPDRTVQLEVFRVTAYLGEPVGRESQPLRWVAPADLTEAGMLPADQPIIAALTSADL